MSDFKVLRESLARLEAFLADHSNELGSLSVEVIAREGEGWDFSLETLRDIAIAARAGVSLATGPKQDSGTGVLWSHVPRPTRRSSLLQLT